MTSLAPYLRPFRLLVAGGLLLLLCLLLTGCAALMPTPEPMPSLTLLEGTAGEECVVFLLPGRGDGASAYQAADFAAIAAGNGRAADLVALDATMGYYARRSVVDRLALDHVAPARAAGKRVWLVGISLGGLGSLLYAAEHPEDVEGIVLLAPFLGEGEVLDEVEAVERLADWDAAGGAASAEARGLWFDLWEEIRKLTAEGGDGPEIVLAFGAGDRLARSHRLLARELPEERIFTVEGGHRWSTWTALWDDLTAAGFPACGGAVSG